MKYMVFWIASFLCGLIGTPDFPLKEIIADGLVKSGGLYVSKPVNLLLNERYYFYANVSPKDSLSVIGEKVLGEDRIYAFIVHNSDSESHLTFSDESIKEWRDKRADEVSMQDAVVLGGRDIDSGLLEQFEVFWVYVYKYKGEYYLHQDWAALMSCELTASTWVQIDMEVMVRGITKLKGNEECFCLREVTGCEIVFRRVDAQREIYQVGKECYMVPARRIRDFQLIGYCNNTGDCVDAFVEWDKNDGIVTFE